MPVKYLPLELVALILGHLRSSELCEMGALRICKSWYPVVKRLIFENLEVTIWQLLKMKSSTVEEIIKHTRALDIDIHMERNDLEADLDAPCERVKWNDPLWFSFMTFLYYEEDPDVDEDEWEAQYHWLPYDSCYLPKCSALHTLRLHVDGTSRGGITPRCPEFWPLIKNLSSTSIKHLAISVTIQKKKPGVGSEEYMPYCTHLCSHELPALARQVQTLSLSMTFICLEFFSKLFSSPENPAVQESGTDQANELHPPRLEKLVVSLSSFDLLNPRLLRSKKCLGEFDVKPGKLVPSEVIRHITSLVSENEPKIKELWITFHTARAARASFLIAVECIGRTQRKIPPEIFLLDGFDATDQRWARFDLDTEWKWCDTP